MPDPDFQDEMLSAYLDGELSPDARSEVEQALAERPQLQQMLEELRSLRAEFQTLPQHQLSSDFYQRVIRQAERTMLNQEQENDPTFDAPTSADTAPASPRPLVSNAVGVAQHKERNWRIVLASVTTVAAACIVAVLLITASRNPPGNQPEMATAPPSESEKPSSTAEESTTESLAAHTTDSQPTASLSSDVNHNFDLRGTNVLPATGAPAGSTTEQGRAGHPYSIDADQHAVQDALTERLAHQQQTSSLRSRQQPLLVSVDLDQPQLLQLLADQEVPYEIHNTGESFRGNLAMSATNHPYSQHPPGSQRSSHGSQESNTLFAAEDFPSRAVVVRGTVAELQSLLHALADQSDQLQYVELQQDPAGNLALGSSLTPQSAHAMLEDAVAVNDLEVSGASGGNLNSNHQAADLSSNPSPLGEPAQPAESDQALASGVPANEGLANDEAPANDFRDQNLLERQDERQLEIILFFDPTDEEELSSSDENSSLAPIPSDSPAESE